MIKQKNRASGGLFLPPTEPLRIPWCALMPDNNRLAWVYGEARKTQPYRDAQQEVQRLARIWWSAPILEQPLAVEGRFYFPDKRKRDVGNYRKLLTDALTGIVYQDDALVIDERWVLLGYDEAARAELTITPVDADWFHVPKPATNKPKLTVFDPRKATPKQLDALKRAMNRRKHPGK